MESPTTPATATSRIPRSRLPVPRAALNVRSSPSRDSLTSADSLTIPRLRGTPSGDQLSSTGKRGSSIGTVIYSPLKAHPQGESNGNTSSRNALDHPTSVHPKNISNPVEKSTPRKLQNPAAPTAPVEDGTTPRKPRQSLSERTMETLSQLPPSPVVRRRESSFFSPDSPMRSPSRANSNSRPGSSYQQDTSMPPPTRSVNSRPSSSAGYRGEAVSADFRASTNTFKPPKSSATNETASKGSITTKLPKTPLKAKSNVNLRSSVISSKPTIPAPSSIKSTKSPGPAKIAPKFTPSKSGSNTIGSKPLRPRASVGGLFRKPSMPELGRASTEIGSGVKKPVAKLPKSLSMAASVIPKTPTKVEPGNDNTVEQLSTPRKSSLALREQIAKAKAAKRSQDSRQVSETRAGDSTEETPIIPAGTFDFGLADDPFNQQKNDDGNKGLLRKRIDSARTDGRLNIAALGLKEIPAEVMEMYNFDTINNNGGSWAESVDLTRLVAADNELAFLGDDIFPDVDPHEIMEDDDSKGNQFGGLETLDLHGNLLTVLPLGLRRLSLLTTLNLSYNKLDNGGFDVISQIASLRDLKVGHNDLTGELSACVAKLKNLEVLDVQHNRLTSLPGGLAELVRLRVLHLSENAFKSLPFETLRRLPLIELSVAKNRLEGVLIQIQDVELPQLQVLDISGNSLLSLALDGLRLPALHQLSCSANRLTSLPNMTSWQSLLTLAAEDNNISGIPEGFTELAKVRNVDLTGNNIKVLDDRIGRMESLDIFRISGNPLREKKFSSMTADDLKRALSARLAPPDAEVFPEESSEVFTSCPSSPTRPNSSSWPVKAGGVLDRSNTHPTSLDPLIAASIAATHTIRVLDLRHNQLTAIPASIIALFATSLTTLHLSHNALPSSPTYLTTPLHLPALTTLSLTSNALSTLTPLTTHLSAPLLSHLDLSFNRFSALPILRTSFPQLSVLLIANNALHELRPECVRGLQVLDACNNELESLDARIGLLGGGEAGGRLERLEVGGNRFRVPRYEVLERGTEATLKWLRDRIPVGEGEDGGLDLDVD